jgi:hypothetical protein
MCARAGDRAAQLHDVAGGHKLCPLNHLIHSEWDLPGNSPGDLQPGAIE